MRGHVLPAVPAELNRVTSFQDVSEEGLDLSLVVEINRILATGRTLSSSACLLFDQDGVRNAIGLLKGRSLEYIERSLQINRNVPSDSSSRRKIR